jgi:hypothetical protein
MSGSGVVFVLTFQAKAPGSTSITTTQAAVVTTKGQSMPVQGAVASVVIR